MSSYTASSVFLQTLVDAGITHAFVNWGSDHPALLADLERQRAQDDSKNALTRPEIVTCPNEMVALSSAQGFAQATGKPAVVIVHVDVGTQALAGAVHNVDRNRCPVIIYAGASPFSAHGEHKGGRNEWIMWMQDIPDQSSIVRQYMRHVVQLNSAQTIPGAVRRAIQIATSEPKGPVYIWARREVMEQELSASEFHTLTGSTGPPDHLSSSAPSLPNLKLWPTLSPSALAPSTASFIARTLFSASRPLIITSHLGRNPNAVKVLVELSDLLVIPVLQVCPSVVSVPTSHPFALGTTFLTPRPPHEQELDGEEGDDHPYTHLTRADTILVVDSDLPWIPSMPAQSPNPNARILVMDGGDPLKTALKMGYWDAGAEAEVVVRADAEVGLNQILDAATTLLEQTADGTDEISIRGELTTTRQRRAEKLRRGFERRREQQDKVGNLYPSSSASWITYSVPNLLTTLRGSIERLATSRGKHTLVLNESITNFPLVWEYMRPDSPIVREGRGNGLTMISSGGSSLGWALGAAVGASLGSGDEAGAKFDLIVVIVGDGSFMFGVPSSVYWMARRYNTPFLTIILNNGGWKAPKLSMLSVHPTLQVNGQGPSSNEYSLANVSGDRLSTGFGPHPPDYVGIAKAASAGWVWGSRVGGDLTVTSGDDISLQNGGASGTAVHSTNAITHGPAPAVTEADPNASSKSAASKIADLEKDKEKGRFWEGKTILERTIEEGIRTVLEEKRCAVLDCVLEGI